MGRAGGVSGTPRNGSRAALRLVLAGLAVVCVAACLQGNAEPIVRVDTDAAAPSDVAPATCDPASAPLPLFYRNLQPSAQANAINFLFKVANRTGAELPLTSLAARYYFTNEITPTRETSVFYAGTCCGASRAGFESDVAVAVIATAAGPSVDHYLEITFDAGAGVLAAGDAVQVEVDFHAPNHAQDLEQTNDYSFVAEATGDQAAWDQCPSVCARFGSCVMTVYRDGARVWGTPP